MYGSFSSKKKKVFSGVQKKKAGFDVANETSICSFLFQWKKEQVVVVLWRERERGKGELIKKRDREKRKRERERNNRLQCFLKL